MGEHNGRKQCPFCGGVRFEEQRVDYLYSHDDNYLLVPNTPVQICLECGMHYYEAHTLREIERRFFAIYQHGEKPDGYINVPMVALA